MLHAHSVSKSFSNGAEEVGAVRGASLSVSPGEFVCLMGPSGCGKSTLLALLAGLLRPDSGDVHLGEVELSALPPDARADVRLRNIGMVYQQDGLIPEFTARENAALVRELLGVPAAEALVDADAALERVGVGEFASRRPDQLSGGQRQRVGIARAIVGTRSVLLADEATGSLDHNNSRKVFELFRALADSGIAVLAATHDAMGQDYAHRTLQMMDGRIESAVPGRPSVAGAPR